MGKVFLKAPAHTEGVLDRQGESNRVTIRKIFDAERKELTDKYFSVNIP